MRERDELAPVTHSITLSFGALLLGGLVFVALASLTNALNHLARALEHPVDRTPARERGPRLVVEEDPAK